MVSFISHPSLPFLLPSTPPPDLLGGERSVSVKPKSKKHGYGKSNKQSIDVSQKVNQANINAVKNAYSKGDIKSELVNSNEQNTVATNINDRRKSPLPAAHFLLLPGCLQLD